MDPTTNTILTYIALGIGFLTAVGTSVSLFLHWLAPRTKGTWDDNAVAKLDELLAFLRGLATPTTTSPAIAVAAPANTTATNDTTTSPQTPNAKAAQAGRVGMMLIAALAALGLVGATALLTGCATLRSDGAVGAAAFIDCEALDVAKLLPDLLPLAKAEVAKWIDGAGKVDTTGLKADLAGIKSDAPRCAIASAIDALATQASPPPGSPAPMQPHAVVSTAGNGDQLRATFASVRGDLGWAPLHLANGRVM